MTDPAPRRVGRRLALVAAVAIAGGVLWYTLLRSDPVPVQVTQVARGRVEQTVSNSRAGTVKARRRAKLSPQVGGQVVKLPARKGDRVRAGDVLLELDGSVQRARLELSRRERDAGVAERIRACQAADRAARELARYRRLAAQRIISADHIDQLDSAARTAAAGCEAAKATEERGAAAIDVAERELAYTLLRSPFDGVVAELSIELGEWTTPSPPVMAVPAVIDVIDPSSIYVSAPMDEVDSARLRPGLAARVAIDSYPGRHFPGHVVRVAPYVLDREEQNRTVEIEVELDDVTFAASLLAGTSADAEVILETRDDVLRLPTGALLTGDKVLLVENDRLVERTVEIGLRNWDVTEIRSGLAEGESVVVSLDRAEVAAGARVTVTPAATP